MKSGVIKAIKVLGALIVVVGALVLYNYLRHVVIWFPKEPVTFESADGVRLSGLLIKPSDEGVFPAAVVLHGSGPEGVDGFSYRVTANAMLRSGLAVLIYDKRGVGASGGDFESALYRDFVADAVAAVGYLVERSDIDETRIVLHGNSEGAWFTSEAELPAELPPYDPATYEGWAADIGYDPGPFLEAIDVPMIYALAEDDINMPTAQIAAHLEAFRQQHGKQIEIVVFDDVGHAMANWTGLFTAGYLPEYLDTIEEWCSKQVDW